MARRWEDAASNYCFRPIGNTKGYRLRANFHRGADPHQRPDLVHFFVGYSNAAFGPVVKKVKFANETLAVGKPVDHDVSSGTDLLFASPLQIGRIGVRDSQGLVVMTVLVAAFDKVLAFRSAVVALPRFRPDWLTA